MRFVGIDLESTVTEPRRLVSVAFAERHQTGAWLDSPGGWTSTLLHAEYDATTLWDTLVRYLEDPNVVLVGMAFHLDLVVLRSWAERQEGGRGLGLLKLVLNAIAERRLADVFWREWLLWVLDPDKTAVWQRGTRWTYVSPNSEDRRGAGDDKRPSMSLEACLKRWAGLDIGESKTGGIRMQYGSMLAKPCSEWPESFVTYARRDPALHLVAFYAQSRGLSVDPLQSYWAGGRHVEGLMTEFMRPRGVQGQGYVFAGESHVIRDSLAFGALSSEGGLYVDREYTERLVLRYLELAEYVTPHDPSVAREHLKQLSLFGEGSRSATEAMSTARLAKTARGKLLRGVMALYDRMPEQWKPPLTPKGREAGAGEGPWGTWTDTERAHFASLSSKVIAEALVTQSTTNAGLAWLGSRDSPAHPLAKIASGGYTLDHLKEDWHAVSSSYDSAYCGLWARVVRDTCYRQVNTGLWPLLSHPEGKDLHPSSCKRLITGRWSAEGGLRTNVSRTGGAREALIPAPGWVIVSADYSTIELFPFALALSRAMVDMGHAQEGYESSLATVLRSGRDPHTMLLLQLYRPHPRFAELLALAPPGADDLTLHDIVALERAKGTPLGKLLGQWRQISKAPNYGFPGLMSAETFLENQRRVGDLSWDLRSANTARKAFYRRWHEMIVFQEWITRYVLGQLKGVYTHFGRLRRGCGRSATIAANNTFQTPVALMASDAVGQVWLKRKSSMGLLRGADCLSSHTMRTS